MPSPMARILLWNSRVTKQLNNLTEGSNYYIWFELTLVCDGTLIVSLLIKVLGGFSSCRTIEIVKKHSNCSKVF